MPPMPTLPTTLQAAVQLLNQIQLSPTQRKRLPTAARPPRSSSTSPLRRTRISFCQGSICCWQQCTSTSPILALSQSSTTSDTSLAFSAKSPIRYFMRTWKEKIMIFKWQLSTISSNLSNRPTLHRLLQMLPVPRLPLSNPSQMWQTLKKMQQKKM